MTENTFTVGQEVVIGRMGSWDMHYNFGYRVTKVTPTGQVTVEFTMENQRVSTLKFNNRGYEMGTSGYSLRQIYADVAGIREQVASKHRASKAAEALNDVALQEKCRSTYSRESMVEMLEQLQAKLDAAKAAVAAI